MMRYRIGKKKEGVFRGDPVERTDGEIVVLSLSSGELGLEVGERIELVGSIEFFVVLSVTALHLAIVPGSIRTNGFVPDA